VSARRGVREKKTKARKSTSQENRGTGAGKSLPYVMRDARSCTCQISTGGKGELVAFCLSVISAEKRNEAKVSSNGKAPAGRRGQTKKSLHGLSNAKEEEGGAQLTARSGAAGKGAEKRMQAWTVGSS